MTAPAVSVVIPVYNDRVVLAECLAGLAAQQGAPAFEVLVVDDGSDDDPASAVAGCPGARCLRQPRSGPAAARNRGAEEAHGALLAFIDADCVPGPRWLVELCRPFDDPGVTGVQGVYTTRQTSLVARFAQYEIEQRYEIMRRARSLAMVGTYSAAFRRDVFRQFGGFDTSFPIASGEDADFSFRLEEAGHRLVLAPEAIVSHRHPATLPRYLRQKFGRAYWRNVLYRKHAGKIWSDAYTPQGLKLEVGLLGLGLVALLSIPVLPAAGWAALLFFVFFLIHTLPLSWRIFRKDAAVGLAAPVLLLGRAGALLCGMAAGFIRTRAGRRAG